MLKEGINLKEGTEFYYADREEGKPIKCKILSVNFTLPPRIKAQREDTKEIFSCYEGFGCYPLSRYEDACEDAKSQNIRLIY